MTTKPKATQYTDYRSFFRDVIRFRQETSREFSLRRISIALGLSSPGYLGMVLNGARNLSPSTLTDLCRYLDVSDREHQFLLSLLKNETNPSDVNIELKRGLAQFSPYFHNEMASTELSEKLVELLLTKTYWIHGHIAEWNHYFEKNEKDSELMAVRNHTGNPSTHTSDIRFYSKEILYLEHDWLFIFWPEPTPQFHSFPLSHQALSGESVFGSMSGIVFPFHLEARPANPAELIHCKRIR